MKACYLYLQHFHEQPLFYQFIFTTCFYNPLKQTYDVACHLSVKVGNDMFYLTNAGLNHKATMTAKLLKTVSIIYTKSALVTRTISIEK